MAKWLALFGLLFIACGEVDGTLELGESGSSKGSSSSNAVSSSGSVCPSINWQDAPESSYVHGSTQITMDAYRISAHPITQCQYKAIMNGENPSRDKNDASPVDGVTWFKAVEFCAKLSAQMGLEPEAVKLPTEAQWEYASPVTQRNPEYWEWTNDCFDSDFPWNGITHDPSGPVPCHPNELKVRKGLNHLLDARFATDPGLDNISEGYITFRVAVKNSFLN